MRGRGVRSAYGRFMESRVTLPDPHTAAERFRLPSPLAGEGQGERGLCVARMAAGFGSGLSHPLTLRRRIGVTSRGERDPCSSSHCWPVVGALGVSPPPTHVVDDKEGAR